jgi:hypothetical protein
MGLTRIRAGQISDIDYKQAVRVITLTDITLSGGAPSLVDGVNLVQGDRILVNGQDDAAQNGLYQVQTLGTGSDGTWVRTSDGNEDGEIQPGMVVMVTQGTIYADTPWKLITNGVIEIGVTELVFAENYSLAFGNIVANGTAVIANVVSAPITFAAGTNVTIVGNNTTKTVTFSATGGSGSPGGADTELQFNDSGSFGGSANLTFDKTAVGGAGELTVAGNIVTGNILTDGYYFANGAPFTPGSGGNGQAIINGESNVVISAANANITMGVAGTSNVVVVSTDGITVQGNVIGNGIPTTTVSGSPPPNPEQGDIWIDSDTGVQLIYFDDGNSSQWAEMEAATSISFGEIIDLSAIDQDLLPQSNATYSLGNATLRWEDVWAAGNVTADYFIGNGSQLTGISTSTSQIFNGSSNVDIAAANADITMSVAGTANVVVVDASGMTVAGNVIGNGISVTTVSNTAPANPEQGDIWINDDNGRQYIYFSSGGNAQWAEMEAATSISIGSSSANIDLSEVDQDIIPAANITYDLGNTTNRWNDLWLANSTIYLGEAQISASGANLELPATVQIGNVTLADSGGNLVLPPTIQIGNAVLSDSGGNLALPENISAVTVTATGNITGGNLSATGNIFIGGTVLTRTLTVGTSTSPITVPLATNNNLEVVGRSGNIEVFTT